MAGGARRARASAGGLPRADPAGGAGGDRGARRIGLLAIEQNAWALADRDPRFEVVASRTELDWAARSGRLSVWAPSKMVMDARERPGDASRPEALAAWLGAEIGAERLFLAGADSAPSMPGALRLDRPEALQAALRA